MSDISTSPDAALAVLTKPDSTIMHITQAITALELVNQPRTVKIGVSSSATVDLLGTYLRKHGLLNGAKIELIDGNYDDPIGDMELFTQAHVEQIVLLPFFDSLLPSFEAQLETLDPAIIDAKEAELRQRYRMVFNKARAVPVIYLGTFHRMKPSFDVAGQDVVTNTISRFNDALRDEASAFANVRIFDTEDIVCAVGQESAFDTRFYFRSKSPYTGAYMNELARRIAVASRGFGAHFYKVLALDCDNTLWGGVIGEDLINGIKLSPHDYPGNIFWCMQNEFAALEQQGVLLALVTKNNPADITEVFQKHPDMVLKDSQIVLKKANWKDKPTNLRELANELNLGLDSVVFLDDSPFECDAVRKQLPQVKTMQVPKTLTDYPNVVAEIKSLFLAGGISEDSKGKTAQYKQRGEAEEIKSHFNTHDEYLASLQLKVALHHNAYASTGRISELSQKSNQFNLTTRRYSVAEIDRLLEKPDQAVYSLIVEDKFGSAGLTGVAILRYEGSAAIVENFFMSCRVIGRGIETVIWHRIAEDAIARGCRKLHAEYIPSAKNAQVATFYDGLGLALNAQSADGARHYCIDLGDFAAPHNSWIEMIYVK